MHNPIPAYFLPELDTFLSNLDTFLSNSLNGNFSFTEITATKVSKRLVLNYSFSLHSLTMSKRRRISNYERARELVQGFVPCRGTALILALCRGT